MIFWGFLFYLSNNNKNKYVDCFWSSQIVRTNICPNRNNRELEILDSIFAIWSPNVKAIW